MNRMDIWSINAKQVMDGQDGKMHLVITRQAAKLAGVAPSICKSGSHQSTSAIFSKFCLKGYDPLSHPMEPFRAGVVSGGAACPSQQAAVVDDDRVNHDKAGDVESS